MSTKEQPDKQRNYWKIFGLLFLIALVAFIAVAYNNKPQPNPYSEKSTDNNGKGGGSDKWNPLSYSCRDVQVPYNETEYVRESYQDVEYYDEYLSAVIVSRTHDTGLNMKYGAYASSELKLKNTDDEAGWFTVTFRWETLKDGVTERKVRHYIEPEETITFDSIYDIDSGEDYSVTHAFLSDPIQKSRTVTKWKTVPKIVTKYKTETQCD